jgi:protein phosphatase
MGLDDHIVLDVSGGKLELSDLFILMSDGVWSAMTPAALHLLCSSQPDPSLLAQELVAAAIRKGGQDNATALVARLEHLPKETLADEFTEAQLLPLPEKLKVGQRLDEFEVEEILHDSRETLLYRARQKPSGRQYVLKTLRPIMAGDTQAKSRLMAEEWLGKRLQSPYFSQVLPLPNRNYLYYAQDWHAGRTLAQALEAGEHFSVTETITLGIRLAKGLSALHRLDIVHRDIKPDNLHLASDNKLRILDLGVALCPTLAITAPEETPGTPSYMAPELFSGGAAGWPSDLYAAGVTLYQVLTRKYPYGEVEPFQHPHFGEPIPPSRIRTDIPAWLENVLLKAVARDPAARFETAEELLLALERGDASGITARRIPLAESNPLILWQGLTAISVVLNLLLLYLLLAL